MPNGWKSVEHGGRIATPQAVGGGKQPSCRDVLTRLNKNTISKWVRNEVDNFSGDILAAFCDYFECDIGNLLYYEKE
jgi:hypothetical protein